VRLQDKTAQIAVRSPTAPLIIVREVTPSIWYRNTVQIWHVYHSKPIGTERVDEENKNNSSTQVEKGEGRKRFEVSRILFRCVE
jgi:hypothetical protein